MLQEFIVSNMIARTIVLKTKHLIQDTQAHTNSRHLALTKRKIYFP